MIVADDAETIVLVIVESLGKIDDEAVVDALEVMIEDMAETLLVVAILETVLAMPRLVVVLVLKLVDLLGLLIVLV